MMRYGAGFKASYYWMHWLRFFSSIMGEIFCVKMTCCDPMSNLITFIHVAQLHFNNLRRFIYVVVLIY